MLLRSTNLPRLLVMSTNPAKLRQFHQWLDASFQIVSASDLALEMPGETGATFAANATLKAVAGWRQTGLVTIADDTGLVVDALDGAPGVYSARYAGSPKDEQRNRDKLLEAMRDVPPGRRSAHFACAIAVAVSGETVHLFEGRFDGQIGFHEAGTNVDGSGYNSLFLLPNGQAMAELTPFEKNRINHRSRATRKAMPLLHSLRNG